MDKLTALIGDPINALIQDLDRAASKGFLRQLMAIELITGVERFLN